MTKEKLKDLAKVLLPVLLALGVSYGFVDKSCVCSSPDLLPEPPAVVAGDAGVDLQ